MAELAPKMVDRMIGPVRRSNGVRARGRGDERRARDTYRAAVRCLVGFDERANLPKIAVPVLCLAGENDPNAPAAGVERMAGKIPGSRYVCLPGVGHLPNLEAPAAFDAAILSFLRQVLAQ